MHIVIARLAVGLKTGKHDIVCVNRIIDVPRQHLEFAKKPLQSQGPRYSFAYADWLVDQLTANTTFFAKCRTAYHHL